MRWNVRSLVVVTTVVLLATPFAFSANICYIVDPGADIAMQREVFLKLCIILVPSGGSTALYICGRST